MHVLTKIFIVLVTLLAVVLVPLVVVYAYNEKSYQAQLQSSAARTEAARAAYEADKAAHAALAAQKATQIVELDGLNRGLQKDRDEAEVQARQLAARLAEAEVEDTEIRGQIATLSTSVDSGQQLMESLINELRVLRTDALVAERQKVDLDEALRDKEAQLDAAVQARRALQEELQRVKEQLAGNVQGQGFIAAAGQPMPGELGVAIDHDVDATIISVRRNSDQVLAEIDAGSRDGVKRGWVMTIGHNGQFVAQLKIIEVDINRATGIIELEDTQARGRVEAGYSVYARAGRN